MSTPVMEPLGYSATAYFDLVARGLIDEYDHVELLEGLIVAAPPLEPLHASVMMAVDEALRCAVGSLASIRVQMPLVAGARSVPEPDVAVVPGKPVDYRDRHPESALLVVEVADSSLPQERLTKSRIYAAAGIPEYWIVNLRDRRLEIFTKPDVAAKVYAETRPAGLDERVGLVAMAGAFVEVSSLFPGY